MNLQRLMVELERDEGRRLKPYVDTVGKVTIGVGRNLSDVGISNAEADFFLANDVERILVGLDDKLPWWRNMDEERQLVLANLAFNVGIEDHTPEGKLLTFKHTLEAMRLGNYVQAGEAMLQSKWARQVGPRARRLAERMRKGEVSV